MSNKEDVKKVVYKTKKRDLSHKLKETSYLTNAQKKLLQKLSGNEANTTTSLGSENSNIAR